MCDVLSETWEGLLNIPAVVLGTEAGIISSGTDGRWRPQEEELLSTVKQQVETWKETQKLAS